jgi:lysophospholipase L1-like esterase
LRWLLLLATLLLPTVATPLLPAVAAAQHVVGFGDSITDLDWDPFPDGSYLSWLDPGWTTEDQGVGGTRTEDIMFRVFDWIGDNNTADAAVILAGTVDAAYKNGYSQAAAVANIEAMIDALEAEGIPVLLAAPPPVIEPCDGAAVGGFTCANFDARLVSLGAALASLASTRGIPFHDLYALFQAAPGGPGDFLLAGDGVHPNLAGDMAIAGEFLPTLTALVGGSDPDTDGDGTPDASDGDDDNDGVADGADAAPLDPDLCQDGDADSCDDCSVGSDGFGPLADNLPANDGPDADADGLCNAGDPDNDNDGVLDGPDSADNNPDLCQDVDADSCDDCAVGSDGFGPLADNLPANDGPDADADGLCNAGDPDNDNDGVLDGPDSADNDPDLCQDADADSCDDCAVGTDGFGPLGDNLPGNDGLDTDADGLCDAGDADRDNDGVADAGDPAPLDPDLCGDGDSDGCDDCAVGSDDFGPLSDSLPGNDGLDTDTDGLCDAGDADRDNDGVADAGDSAPLDPDRCVDADLDTCDDCAVGSDGFGPLPDVLPATDGLDTDGDGKCNGGDWDDDGDGINDLYDLCPLDAANVCPVPVPALSPPGIAGMVLALALAGSLALRRRLRAR